MLNNARKIQMINSNQVIGEYESIKKMVTKEFKGLKSIEKSVQKICSGAKKSPLMWNDKEVYFKYVE